MQQPLEQASELTLSALDDAWVEHVHAIARACFGSADLEGDKLLDAIAQVSRGYTTAREGLAQGRSRTSDLVARLKLFTVRDAVKIELPLRELLQRDALPRRSEWRVLDVGAGLGAMSLGTARLAKRVGVERVVVHALDRDAEALRVFERLSQDVSALQAAPITLTTQTLDLTRAPASVHDQRFDLIVIGFVLNELWPDGSESERVTLAAEWLRTLSRQLREDGVLIVVEPALHQQSRQLQRVRDALAARVEAPFVFAPCTRRGPCPMLQNERDWCHTEVPFQLPSRTAALARKAGLRDHDLTFSYLTLRMQPGHVGELAVDAGAQGGERDMVQRVVSAPLPSKGKLELMTCSEAGLVRLMRLDRHRSERNAAFDLLDRGALVQLRVSAQGGRARVEEADHVDVIWRWRR